MKNALLAVVALILSGRIFTATVAAAEPNKPLSILGNVALAYSAVTAYQDSGVVLIHDPGKEEPDEIIFQMLFLRPDMLRFEWIRHHPYPPLRHIKTASSIWPDGQGSHLMATGEAKPRAVDLDRACAGAAGVSRGSSQQIPRLLTPTVTGFALTDLTDVKLLGEEVFEGVPCHRLEGKNQRGSVIQLYVGQKDYFIRRILRKVGESPSEEIHRTIRINGDVTPLAPK